MPVNQSGNDTPTYSRKTHLVVRASIVVLMAGSVASCYDDDDDWYFRSYDVPNSVVIADLNADGAADLAVAATREAGGYPDAGFASIILQNLSTPGSFQRGVDMSVGGNPAILAVGDLDATGDADLVVANTSTGNVSVLLQGATAGQYVAARNIATGGVPYDVTIGDLNNDGLNDIAVANAASSGTATNTVIVLFQNPASIGNYLTPVTLDAGNLTTAVAIGDVNGDALPDLVVTSFDTAGNNGRVSVFRQDAANAGQFLTRLDFAAGARPMSVRIADLNGDALPDLAIANEGPGSSGVGSSGVSILLQNATTLGTFLAPVTYATASGAIHAVVGDLNGDSRPDLVVANLGGSRAGTISVLLQDPARAGVFLSATNYAGVYGPLSVAIGDLNGDSRPDIAAADGDRATIMLQSATTPGTFAAPVPVG